VAEPAWLPGKRAAAALRLELGLGFEPIDIWDVIRRRGVTFALHDFGEEAGDGLYVLDERGGLIMVNAAKRASKQRFTAAHELGHHELHRFDAAQLVIADKDVSRTEGRPEEVAANAFAAYLMAPDEGLKTALEDRRNKAVGVDDVVELMRRFGLSFDATVFRLNNTGLINQANATRLRDEAAGIKELLTQRAGFREEDIFPPGSPLPPVYLSHAMALYQEHVISPNRLAELLDVPIETALDRAEGAGYQRAEEPEPLHADAAADLLAS
jgi:Zn-dependent peptidase ImmA (M78 family)